jgi:hypothetical protein
MRLTAYLLAFTTDVPIPTREIEIPAERLAEAVVKMTDDTSLDTAEKIMAAGRDLVLGLAYELGQEDFQRRGKRSVSVGDVIRLEDGSLHRVLGAGWEHLPKGTDINKLERGLAASLR